MDLSFLHLTSKKIIGQIKVSYEITLTLFKKKENRLSTELI